MLLVKSMPVSDQTEVQDALQRAIQIEHATIPPYLTALYSLIPGKNDAIASILQDIVIQEMKHMATVANILNAVGGSPAIDAPDFIPTYPGGLPFHIGDRNGQTFSVSLAPFSLDLVRDVFMRVEEPDQPIVFPEGTRLSALIQQRYQTIGDFYRDVRNALKSEWFTGDPARQVDEDVDAVHTLADAQVAIDKVVQQGEGTSTKPLAGGGTKLAHYYLFEEISKQRSLVPDANVPEGYSFSGAPILFDPTGVLPLTINPSSALYPEGSLARTKSDIFNKTYSDMLRALHATFNGDPIQMLDAKVLMSDLTLQAVELMRVSLGNGLNAAPCYEYLP